MDYLLHHTLISSEKRFGSKIAVGDKTSLLTYASLSTRTAFLARRLLDCGLRRGDRVAVYCNHCCDLAVAIFGISSAGGVFVPINHQLFPHQIRHILSDSEARILLTQKDMQFNLTEPGDTGDFPHTTLLMDSILGEEKLCRHTGAIENDLAAILYTSGSTGPAKGVMLSHRNLIAGSRIVTEYLGLTQKDRLLGLLPLSFDYGLNQLLTMVANGGSFQFFSFRWPNEIVDALHRYKITGLAGVPSLWIFLARSSLGQSPLPHLRYITNSGGAIPVSVLKRLRRSIPGVDIFLMYGLTEAFRSTYLPPRELNKRPTSIGKAVPNTEIFVVSEDGTLCGPDEPGMLVHRGPTVALGYWKRQQETRERFRDLQLPPCAAHSTEKVVYSGDIVRRDNAGYLYFIGRKDAMIKSSGYRISPTEIEEVAYRSCLIREAAALGYSHSTMGQSIKLLVVPVSASQDLQQRIISFCAQSVPSYMVPSVVELVDFIPKTPTGKIDYPLLYGRLPDNSMMESRMMERKNADHGLSPTVA